MKKFEALIASGLTADVFRTVCEKLGKDPDAEDFYGIDINDIKDYASKNGLAHFSNSQLKDGYSIEEAAELLQITKQSFSVTYAPKVIKIRRGVYSRESVDALVNKKFGIKSESKNTETSNDINTITIEKSTGKQRIQRITVNDNSDGVSVTLHLENYTHQEVLGKLLKLFN